MFDMSGAFGGWINHQTEMAQIIEDVAMGRTPCVGDYYSWQEIEAMEDELYKQYNIKEDLSYLHRQEDFCTICWILCPKCGKSAIASAYLNSICLKCFWKENDNLKK